MNHKKSFSFTRTFFYTGGLFIIIVPVIEAIFSLFTKAGFDGFLQNFTYPLVIKYAIAKLIGAGIYGLFMAFILKRKAEKLAGK